MPLCTGVSRVWLPLDSVCRHRARKAWDERRDVRLTLENSNLQALAEKKKMPGKLQERPELVGDIQRRVCVTGKKGMVSPIETLGVNAGECLGTGHW